MTTRQWCVCAAVTLFSTLAITSSRAEDLSVPSVVIDPKDVRQSDAAAGQVRGDDVSRITDLESARSGWVAEQVIHAR